MPLNEPALELAPDPRSVQEARRWVVSACGRLGRGDLTECAELGVSELVTNALLHAVAPISIRVRGTADHPRVEVQDGSPQPPVVTPPPETTGDELDDLLSTFGRGLTIVAMCSVAWGAAIETEGKTVWFEPADSPHQEDYPAAEVFHAGDLQAPPTRAADEIDVSTGVEIQINGVPLDHVAQMRRHYFELRRELRLLSLAHQDDYPLAHELSGVFERFEQSFPSSLTQSYNAALLNDEPAVDLRVLLHPDASTVIEQMLDLLDLADEFCRAKRLLSLARSPEQRTFQQWYFGEFVRQAHGESPVEWPPPTSSDTQHVS